MDNLIEKLERALDDASPVEWVAIGRDICDKQEGFEVGRLYGECYPSELDQANAELVVLLVNNAPDIIAALKARGAGG